MNRIIWMGTNRLMRDRKVFLDFICSKVFINAAHLLNPMI